MRPLPWLRSTLGRVSLASTLVLLFISPSYADVMTWTNAAGGDWNVAANWNSGAGPVPGASDDAVITLDGTYTVRVTGSVSVASLALGGGSGIPTLRVEGLSGPGPATLTVANGVTNNGTIELTNANPNFSATLAVTSGVLVNAATGVVTTMGTGGNRTLTAVLDNHGIVTAGAVGLTINKGSAAHVNRSGGTIAVSSGNLTVSQSGTSPSFTNSGAVMVNAGRTLTISDGSFTHDGTLSGAGTLALSSVSPADFNAAQGIGTISLNTTTASFATDQSTAATAFSITGSTLNGPGSFTNATGKTLVVDLSTINMALVNQGTLVVHRTCAQNGTLTVAAGSILRIESIDVFQGLGFLTVANGFTNQGTIELTSTTTVTFTATLAVTSGVLVNAAGGTIDVLAGAGGFRALNAVLENHGALTLGVALTVSKASAAHVNHPGGTISVSGGSLTVDQFASGSSFSNHGIVTVAAGRTFSIDDGAFAHDGTLSGAGTLSLSSVSPAAFDAAHGLGAITLNNTTASFATDQSTAATTFSIVGSTLNGPGTFTNAAGKTLVVDLSTINMALVNQGTLVWHRTSAQNGTLTAAAGSILRLESIDVFQGAGVLTVASGFTNQGTIELTSTTSLTFTATLAVTSGVLVNAAGGAITVLAGGGGLRALNATLENHGALTLGLGLTINKAGADHVNHAGGTITVSGGNLTLTQSGTTPSFTNHGTVTVNAGRTWTVSGGSFTHDGTLSGAGALALSSVSPADFDATHGLGAVSLVSSTTASFALDQGSATTYTVTNSTVNGPGSLTNATGKTMAVQSSTINAPLVNQGTVVWRQACAQNGALTTAAGSMMRIESINVFQGTGVLTVASGFTNQGTIELTSTTNLFTTTLAVTSGVLVNAAGGAINVLAGGGGPRTLTAVLDNDGAVSVGLALTINKASAAHANRSGGAIAVNGGNLTVSQSGTSPSFTNQGTMTVGAGRTWTVTGGTLQNAAGGVLRGAGTINVSATSFADDGVISPGTSAGVLTVTGNLPRTANAQLEIELGGTTAGTGYDRLAVSGQVTLDGTLNVTLINGFMPSPGDEFRIMTFGSSTGSCGGVELGGGLSLEAHCDATGITLRTVGQTWVQLIPLDAPPNARDSHSAVYDPTGNRMIVFGGMSDAGPLGDVWALTHANGQGGTPYWIPLSPAGGPPAARGRHSAVYDPTSNRMIVYGGDDATPTPATLGDVWVLTEANGLGGTPAWISLSASGGPPPLRTQHTAVYDAAGNRMIVFGGNASAGSCASGLNDAWVLSNANGLGGTPTWTPLSPTGGPPSPRWSHNAGYDPATNRLTIFGGDVSCSSSNNEVWVLTDANGQGGAATWSQLSPSGTIPDPWSLHSGVYDPATNRLATFGGVVTGVPTNQVKTLTAANGASGSPLWTDLWQTSPQPAPRSLHSAVQDVANPRMVVFGGNSGSGRLKDVWVLEQAAARIVDVPAIEPPPLSHRLGFSRAPAPNPIRETTRFTISVPREQFVDLSVYDVSGRRVAGLFHGVLAAGEHPFEWRPSGSESRAVSGLYFLRLGSGGETRTLRLVLAR